jgi:hypothetical protein
MIPKWTAGFEGYTPNACVCSFCFRGFGSFVWVCPKASTIQSVGSGRGGGPGARKKDIQVNITFHHSEEESLGLFVICSASSDDDSSSSHVRCSTTEEAWYIYLHCHLTRPKRMTATLIKPKVSIINKSCFTKVTCEMHERLLAITSHMVLMAVVGTWRGSAPTFGESRGHALYGFACDVNDHNAMRARSFPVMICLTCNRTTALRVGVGKAKE